MKAFTGKKRLAKLAYMHGNPVKRGLVTSPDQWPGSSFRFYYLEDASVLRVARLDQSIPAIRARAAQTSKERLGLVNGSLLSGALWLLQAMSRAHSACRSTGTRILVRKCWNWPWWCAGR